MRGGGTYLTFYLQKGIKSCQIACALLVYSKNVMNFSSSVCTLKICVWCNQFLSWSTPFYGVAVVYPKKTQLSLCSWKCIFCWAMLTKLLFQEIGLCSAFKKVTLKKEGKFCFLGASYWCENKFNAIQCNVSQVEQPMPISW